MKKVILTATRLVTLLLCLAFIFLSCDGVSKKQTENENSNSKTIDYMHVKDKSFEELFRLVEADNIKSTLAELMVQEEHTVITAGTDSLFNSMAASWEAMARYFQKPTTFCLLGAKRYTLELIEKHQSYTMSFFPDQFEGEVYAFGSKSGRDSNKMKETKLTYVKTPSGNITYREARVVIECQLLEITTVQPDDFYTEEAITFVEKDGGDYHKLVFGTITKIWVRK